MYAAGKEGTVSSLERCLYSGCLLKEALLYTSKVGSFYTHSKELKEGYVLMLRAIALFIVVKEEKVCQANIKHVCVVAVLLHKV